jgi:ATP-dependent Lhr-like helicase
LRIGNWRNWRRWWKFKINGPWCQREGEFLVEFFKTRDGFHFCFYPFEGRYIHEILASLVAYRIARTRPISFSIGMNDYGFELLSDQEIDPEEMLSLDLLSARNLEEDLKSSINEAEMARRKFRDIATISGLVFNGFPGVAQTNKHLQSGSQLIFDTLTRYDPDNLLLKQAHDEVLDFSVETRGWCKLWSG